jgi:hypothetical protein
MSPLYLPWQQYPSCASILPFTLSPSLWLVYIRPSRKVFEDIMQDYAQKTVTIEPHPHTGRPHASIHPCQHSAAMKRVLLLTSTLYILHFPSNICHHFLYCVTQFLSSVMIIHVLTCILLYVLLFVSLFVSLSVSLCLAFCLSVFLPLCLYASLLHTPTHTN